MFPVLRLHFSLVSSYYLYMILFELSVLSTPVMMTEPSIFHRYLLDNLSNSNEMAHEETPQSA